MNVEYFNYGAMLAEIHKASTRTNFASVGDPVSDWYGGLNYKQALECLESGWKDAPAIQSVTVPNVAALLETTNYYNDVIGDSLDMGAYLAGVPDCMIASETTQLPGPKILKLSIEIGGNCFVGASEMANRGHGLIALINSLELAGYSVELAIVRAYGYGTLRGDKRRRFVIAVKQAGEMLDTRRIQFIVGHPSFYRRLLFGFSEQQNNASMHDVGTRTETYAPEGYHHIPHNEGLASSPAGAIKWAQEYIRKFTEPAQ